MADKFEPNNNILSFSEYMKELQEQKKNLVSEILDGTESRASLTLDEIREILGIS